MAGWGREGLSARLPLTRLTPAEAEALVRALGGDPALAGRAQAQSAGNPYFLIELVQAGGADVPPALAELVRARLDRLPDTARQVAQAAAVLEPDFDFPTLRAPAGAAKRRRSTRSTSCSPRGRWWNGGGRYEFSHPFVAAVVRDGLSGARRAFIHRRAAEALEAAHSGRLAPVAGRLADHYAQAGDAPRAARYADMAAAYALAVAAPAEAAQFARQALALEPTPARQVGLGWRCSGPAICRAARAAYLAARQAFAGGRRPARRWLTPRCSWPTHTCPPAGPQELLAWVERALPDLDDEPSSPPTMRAPIS